MAKKPPAVYEPGELDRIRKNLGVLDVNEARRVAGLLGGEVGVEKEPAPPAKPKPASRDETVEVMVKGSGRDRVPPSRRVEILADSEEDRRYRRRSRLRERRVDPEDDPSIALKVGYVERIRMDRLAAQPEFDIKTPTHVLYSMLALFGETPDLVSASFTTQRMNEYYKRIESLVTTTRGILPRANIARIEQLRKISPYALTILEVIRDWNLERISGELASLQARPREALVGDFAEIMKAVYRPLWRLSQLDSALQIKNAYLALLRVLLMEHSAEAKAKYQGLVRMCMSAWTYVSTNIRYLLYPLLLKFVSDRVISYDELFATRKRRIMAFLSVSERDLIPSVPPEIIAPPEPEGEEPKSETVEEKPPAPVAEKDAPEIPSSQETNRALQRGLGVLDDLFPKVGLLHPERSPELYPYFASIFEFKKGVDLIPPKDPLQLVVVLMHVLEELFYGLRYVSFGNAILPGPEAERLEDIITRIIGEWHGYIETVLGKEYLPRLMEYCRILDNPSENRTSNYAKRTLAELMWIRRLYFLPHLRFESILNHAPFKRSDDSTLFGAVRELRHVLTYVAAGIEAGSRAGGAARNVHCEGIDNPWAPYIFQVPNPVSERLDSLLGGRASRRKTNAALVFYTLSVTAVLDYMVNDEASWAYPEEAALVYRSIDLDKGEGTIGLNMEIDADLIFRQAMRERQEKKRGSDDAPSPQ